MSTATRICTLTFGIIYIAAFASAVFVYQFPFADLLTIFLLVGVAFSVLAWLVTLNNQPAFISKPTFKNESAILIALIAWVILYITYGGDFVNGLFPKNIQQSEQWQFFIVLTRKLFVFIIIPFLAYRAIGFSIKDFGLIASLSQTFTRRNVLLLVTMSAAILLFEYFFSVGAKPLRDEQFSFQQLLFAIPISFLWLIIEAGLVEEFFFRAILQTRLAVLIKSEWGGILIGGLIFGLVHVPGLYLRGAESEGISEQLPVWFWLSYCLVNMSIAGIFLGIIWSKTKNLYLVIILHAMLDLLPNVSAFIHTWKI